MAVTTVQIGMTKDGRRILRHIQVSGADAINSVSVPGGKGRRVLQVTVAYSGSPTQAGVTAGIDSGAGAGYDSTLNTGTANARYTNYLPSVPPVIGADDAFVVAAPAGGGSLTSSVAVYTEDI